MPAPTTPPSSTTTTEPQSKITTPVYFWRPKDPNGYLGQWYPSTFTVDGETYATAEMWMMVQKARLFGDEKIALQMLSTRDPRQHKALGRRVSNFNESVWNAHKFSIVEQGNMYKFTISQDAKRLRDLLVKTGERELVEASPLDRIWGIGFVEGDAEGNREVWGENLLGRVLGVVRERVRGEGESGVGK